MSLWEDGVSFGYMPRSCIVESWGRSISNFLRNHNIDLQSGYTSLYSYQQLGNVLFVPQPLQNDLSLVFLILEILEGISDGISDSF